MEQVKPKQVEQKGFNIFMLVVIVGLILVVLNVLFYQVKLHINYFEFAADLLLLIITFYLIYISQKHSTNKSGFYYYTAIGFAFLFFALLIMTLGNIYIYQEKIVNVSTKMLFVFGYGLLAIGVTKWVSYNESKQDELTLQANTDELTGLLNRRSFTSFIQFEFNKSKTLSEPFSLIILDIDYFKKVNDTHGHLVGDEVLKNLANLLQSSFRSADKVCRWGGEEFAILLPDTSLNNAINIAEKIRKKIQQTYNLYKGIEINYTISLGVSESLTSDKRIDDLIARSDAALYNAKNSTRNCVESLRAL